MKTWIPEELGTPRLHQLLLGSIGPRPICFASTIDAEGNRNLSPFSFFNVFSANPPILVFSPARSGRTGQTKNTLDNCYEVPEVVVNVVNFDIVQQMSLSSSPYPKGVDEFVKSGLTPIKSDVVRPYRVKESPVQYECTVDAIHSLGDGGGAGNLIVARVVKIHISESVLDASGMIDQEKIDLVARMGGDYYCRAHGSALFQIPKPITSIGMGVDNLPAPFRSEPGLTGNHLGQLGLLEVFPEEEAVQRAEKMSKQAAIELAKNHLEKNELEAAYCVLKKNLE